MKRLVALFTLAIVAFSSFAAMAASPGAALPAGAQQVYVWQWNGTAWELTNYAKSWNSEPNGTGGMSNKEVHTFEIVNHISVAQWIDFHLSGTRKDWRVLRPGTYASDSVTVTLSSNNDVIVEFYAEDPVYESDEAGVTRTIAKWFSLGAGLPQSVIGWLRAAETSAEDPFTYRILDSAALHNGYTMKVWEMIEVLPSNSSSDYEGKGYLTLRLTNLKHWVDPETGTWYKQPSNVDPHLAGGFGPLDPDWAE